MKIKLKLQKNKIKKINFKEKKIFSLSKKKYHYNFINNIKNKNIDLSHLKSMALFIIKCGPKSYLKVNNIKKVIKDNQIILVNNNICNLNLDNKKNIILIAGTKTNKIKKKSYKNFHLKESYRVNKHWGNELWINNRDKNFSFKKIFLKKGKQTSLQLHEKKRETNFLFKGTAYLHYLSNNKRINTINLNKDIKKIKIKAPVIIDVDPETIHRIEAIDNLTLYEVSTPHLDDVIRIQDDKSRKSGLIISEHQNN